MPTWGKREAFETIAGEEATRLGAVFERFVAKRPISVVVRETLERVLGADQLDLWYARMAPKQYPRVQLFSTVYDVMRQVVLRLQPSVHAAYRASQGVGPSIVAVYNKLDGRETHAAAARVRYSACMLAPLIAHVGGARQPWLEG